MSAYDLPKSRQKQRCHPIAARVAVVFALCACLTDFLGASADAHGKTGKIAVAETVKNDDGTTTFEIAITFDGDGDPAPNAAVTVVAEQVDALKVGPVKMAPVSGSVGRYSATIALSQPGEWQLRFTSLTPKAYLETTFIVEPQTTSTSATTLATQPASTTAPTPGPTPGPAPTSAVSTPVAPSPTTRLTSIETIPSTRTSQPTDTTKPTTPGSRRALFRNTGVVMVGGLAAIGVTVWLLRRRRKP
jgi:hypothetical protein